jgi:GntR family transcriptional regulator
LSFELATGIELALRGATVAEMTTVRRNNRNASGPLARMKVDTDSPIPLYHQIFDLLREAISEGGFGDQSILPSEHELSRQFGVSRITAKRSLDELAAAGLVIREQGRGTRVNPTPARIVVRGGIASLVQSLHANGRHSVKLIDFGYVSVPADIAEVLNLEEGAMVQRAIRVWNGPQGPFSHLTTFVPEKLGRSWTKADLQKVPMISLLETKNRIGKSQEQITATAADRAIASRLSVKRGSPLLTITRTIFNTDGVPVEHIVASYPPDRYQYLISLE